MVKTWEREDEFGKAGGEIAQGWECDEAGSYGGESIGYTAEGEVVVKRVYGVREGEHGGSAMVIRSLLG